MPKGNQDHGGIAVAPAVVLGCLDQPLYLPLGQVLAGPVLGISLAANCALFVGWGDHFEGRNSSHFPLLRVLTMHLSYILYTVARPQSAQLAALFRWKRRPVMDHPF